MVTRRLTIQTPAVAIVVLVVFIALFCNGERLGQYKVHFDDGAESEEGHPRKALNPESTETTGFGQNENLGLNSDGVKIAESQRSNQGTEKEDLHQRPESGKAAESDEPSQQSEPIPVPNGVPTDTLDSDILDMQPSNEVPIDTLDSDIPDMQPPTKVEKITATSHKTVTNATKDIVETNAEDMTKDADSSTSNKLDASEEIADVSHSHSGNMDATPNKSEEPHAAKNSDGGSNENQEGSTTTHPSVPENEHENVTTTGSGNNNKHSAESDTSNIHGQDEKPSVSENDNDDLPGKKQTYSVPEAAADDSRNKEQASPVPEAENDDNHGKEQPPPTPEADDEGQAQESQEENLTSTLPRDNYRPKADEPDYMDLDEPATIEVEADKVSEASQEQATATQTDSENSSPEDHASMQHDNVRDDGKDEVESEGTEEEETEQSNEQTTAEGKASKTPRHETSSDKTASTEGGKQSEENSLVSFMEKVKNKQEQNLSGQPQNDNTTKATKEVLDPPGSSEDLSRLEEAAKTMGYSGTWGVFNNDKRHADVEILSLLFDKQLVDNASNRYNKVFEPVPDLVIPTLYSKIMNGEETNDDVTDLDDGSTVTVQVESPVNRRSVNAEFVEGLDDLEKFFEGVDPPDELDVGAAGTSIQDVLMGQTSKIVIKRVTRGAQYVSKMFRAGKARFSEYMEKEDRKFPELKKEHFVQSKDWVLARGKDVFLYAKDLFETILVDEDELEGDEFMNYANDLEKKLRDMTTSKEGGT